MAEWRGRVDSRHPAGDMTRKESRVEAVFELYCAILTHLASLSSPTSTLMAIVMKSV